MSDVPSNLIPTRITQLPDAPVASEDSLLLIVYQGNNYKIRAGDLLQVAGVPISRQVIAGTGLSGGGPLSSNVTLSVAPGGIGPTELANTGVTPGVYGTGTQVPVFTVDAKGRVTAATSIAVQPPADYVPNTRQVIAGAGLSGGGALNSNVTLSADFSDSAPLTPFNSGSAGTSSELSRADHRHPAIDLSDANQVDNILPINQGGTGRSLVMNAGAIVWSGADGLYVGPAGTYGQVLASGGAGEYFWANVATDLPVPAHYVWIGPASGIDAAPTYRLLVSDDLPAAISGKAFTSSTINNCVIGGITPADGSFVTVTASTANVSAVNTTTIDASNIEVTNLKAQDGTAAGSIASVTGIVTLNSAVLTTADITGGTINNTAIGGSTPSTGKFTQVDVDNLRLDGNTLSSTDTNGNLVLSPNGSGDVQLDADTVRVGDSNATATVTTNGTGDLTLSTNGGTNSGVITITQGTNGNITLDPNGTGEVSIPAGIDGPLYIDFNTVQSPLPSAATGRLFYNNENQFETLTFQMNSGAIQHVGMDQYYRIKCQGSITKGQVVSFAGTVGASGGLIGKAATGLTVDQANYILGIAVESGANNDWIFVSTFGEVKGIDTTGGAESWVQGQILYYNPAVTGGLTKTKPSAPNPICIVAAVVYVSASNGILYVRPTYGSVLGGSDGNVQFGTLNNNDLIQYNATGQYWQNVAPSSIAIGTATNLAGGNAGSVPYQTGAGATTFLGIGSALQVLKVNAGATAPEWVTGAALTKTDDTNVTLTLGGTPSTSLLAATSLTLGWTGQLAVGRGGTGANTFTANGVLYGNTTSALQATAAGTTGQVLVGNTSAAPSWSDATSVAVTSLSFGTTGLTPNSATQGAVTVSGTLITTNGGTGLSSYTAGDLTYYATGTALSKLAIGANTYVLTSSGTAPQWSAPSGITVGTATNAVNVGVTDDTSTNATMYPVWVTANTGNLPAKVTSTKLSFNPSSGILTATGGIAGGAF